MMMFSRDIWHAHSAWYSFFGNSLLAPMSCDGAMGLEPRFWDEFPFAFHEKAMEGLRDIKAATRRYENIEACDVLQDVNLAYAKLFIGPPRPAAPPWETAYRSKVDKSVLFGQATFEMHDKLRKAGLAINNERHQLADHIGLELLYLAAESDKFSIGRSQLLDVREVRVFIEERLLSWIGSFTEAVVKSDSSGYYAGMAKTIWGVLLWDIDQLKACG